MVRLLSINLGLEGFKLTYLLRIHLFVHAVIFENQKQDTIYKNLSSVRRSLGGFVKVLFSSHHFDQKYDIFAKKLSKRGMDK